MGVSVTQRIKQINQPRGGFIHPKMFKIITIKNKYELNPQEEENIHPILIGLVVDYLTRFMITKDVINSFRISFLGAINIKDGKNAQIHLNNIKGLDDLSIISAIKLSNYDVAYRVGPEIYKPLNVIPSKKTLENIKIMVLRGLEFFDKWGPITSDGFTFGGAYNDTISSGDGDFLTKNILWDFKVSKYQPNKNHTLQLVIYYLMGKKSNLPKFKTIHSIGIFNPRLNIIYLLKFNSIEKAFVQFISICVIGYE